ncbi:MlaD family protein [Urbifossiella limnaea]|nr:MlaD family protein [Urbifossiella limnaea]
MAEQKMRMRLGLFVGATLVVLAVLVVLFGKAPQLFATKLNYTVLFPEAPGLTQGTPIRKSGVRIGEVKQIDLDAATGEVRVHITVDPKHPPRTNEAPTITRGLLNGDTALDFLPKLDTAGQPLPRGDDIPPGSEIAGVPPITPRSLLTPASGVLSSAQQSLDRVVASFEKIERVAPQLEKTLREYELLGRDVRAFIPEVQKTNKAIQDFVGGAENPAPPPGAISALGPPIDRAEADNLRNTLRDIRSLVATVRPAVDELRGSVKRIEPDVAGAAKAAREALESVNQVLSPENQKEVTALLKNLNAIGLNILKVSGGLQAVLDETEKTIRNFDTRTSAVPDAITELRGVVRPFAARSEALTKDVAETAASLNAVLTDVRGVVQAFARENGTAQRLLTDPTLFNNVDAAAASLARVLARAERIAGDLEVFADKVARRPELIGVGGAVRPSSGLKDSPFAPTPVPPGLPAYRPDWPPAVPATRPAPDGGRGPVQGYRP